LSVGTAAWQRSPRQTGDRVKLGVVLRYLR
jgi:hypothetical protein